MIETIYVEREILSHETCRRTLTRYRDAHVVPIDRYTEIFNRKNQNFRLQKQKPSLILAKKYGEFIHPIPALYGVGSLHNYYFSHVLNCPYDCKYCFLQGMFRSADFVLFVNYEDFRSSIEKKIKEHSGEKITFFSGYDGDSLALEPTTGFIEEFYPFFEERPEAEMEIRTKSIAIRPLLERRATDNIIAAYTLSPEPIAQKFELKAPPSYKRIEAIQKLQKNGWQIGLRFDPVIDGKGAKKIYLNFYHDLFAKIDLSLVHSVTLGPFRLPKPVGKIMRKLMPYEPLLAAEQGEELLETLEVFLKNHLPKEKIFLCHEPSSSQEPAPV